MPGIPELGTWKQENQEFKVILHYVVNSRIQETWSQAKKKKDDGSLFSDAPSSSSLFTSAHLTRTLTTQLYSEKNCENIIFPFTECLGFCAGMPH